MVMVRGLQQQQPGYLSSGQRGQEAERINCKLSDGEMAGRELRSCTDWPLTTRAANEGLPKITQTFTITERAPTIRDLH